MSTPSFRLGLLGWLLVSLSACAWFQPTPAYKEVEKVAASFRHEDPDTRITPPKPGNIGRGMKIETKNIPFGGKSDPRAKGPDIYYFRAYIFDNQNYTSYLKSSFISTTPENYRESFLRLERVVRRWQQELAVPPPPALLAALRHPTGQPEQQLPVNSLGYFTLEDAQLALPMHMVSLSWNAYPQNSGSEQEEVAPR